MGEDRRLSDHLMLHEVTCKCGQCDGGGITPEMVLLFERIRAQCVACKGVDIPITVSSGYRCPDHNERVNPRTGRTGPHTKGIALDLLCPQGLKMDEFHGICLALNPLGGVGFYRRKGFIHVDTRGKKDRWDG
jgi:uncharacterized protein YcbK (DUF882 family)